MKKKSKLILLLILSALVAIFCMQGFMGIVHEKHTRLVERDFGAALHQLQDSPPGVQRVETFVTRLKAINTGYVPTEVKQALQGYVAAVEQSVDAAKAGRDTAPYDPAIAQAKQKLTDSVREYD
jgi:hypothetical protein